MFFRRGASGADWVVAGLGNPGKKHEGTRHNAGFEAMDALAAALGADVRRSRFEALCGSCAAEGQRVLLLKPQTFMNLSGKSLLAATAFYKLPPRRVIVLCDDVALAPGVLRVREAGSAGGHNGLKSIIALLGENFARVRIGVGTPPHPEYDMADWVLGRPAAAERGAIAARWPDVVTAVRLLLRGMPQEAMNRCNGKGQD